MAEICSALERLYLQLRAGKHTHLKQSYVDKLYQLNKSALYQKDGEVFEGYIRGVTDVGLLQMKTLDGDKEFNFKEIVFLNLS